MRKEVSVTSVYGGIDIRNYIITILILILWTEVLYAVDYLFTLMPKYAPEKLMSLLVTF